MSPRMILALPLTFLKLYKMAKGAFRIPLYNGGTSNPDPAIYCPANGYLPPYQYFESPIEVTTVYDESIVFILDTDITNIFDKFYIGADTTGNYIFSYYDENETLLREDIIAVATAYYTVNEEIPDSTMRYVKCIVTLQNGSSYFVRLSSSVTSAVSTCAVAIYANTPNLNTNVMFRGHVNLKIVQFLCNLDYVGTMDYLLHTTGVERFVMPQSMAALTQMQYVLIDAADIRSFIFPAGFSAPLLVNLFYFSARAYNLESIAIPDIPSLTDLSLGFYYSRLKALEITGCEAMEDISQMLEYSFGLEILSLPSFPNLTDGSRVLSRLTSLRKVTFSGEYAITGSDWLQYCTNLYELHYPRQVNAYGSSLTDISLGALTNLRIIEVPDYLNFSANYAMDFIRISAGSTTNVIRKVYGDFEFASDEATIFYLATYYKDNLEEVNLPKCKIARISIGGNLTTYFKKLTTVEVDWANSSYLGTSPQIQFSAPFDTAWLDAMFTALPTVTGGQTIDVRFCDGYAGCTPSIATAKGWTVL